MNKSKFIVSLLIISQLYISCKEENIGKESEFDKSLLQEETANSNLQKRELRSVGDEDNFIIDENGVLTGITDEAIVNGKLVIPPTVKEVGDKTSTKSLLTNFQLTNLKELVIGDNTSDNNVILNGYAFYGAKNLHKITFGEKINRINGLFVFAFSDVENVIIKSKDLMTERGINIIFYKSASLENESTLTVPLGSKQHYYFDYWWHKNFLIEEE